MGRKFIYILLVLSCIFYSSLLTAQVLQQPTTGFVELGTIGKTKHGLLNKDNIQETVPVYKQKIRVGVSILPFNKANFNKFKRAASHQNSKVTVTYIDSLPNKPKFVQLQIIDKVQVLKELNANYNEAVRGYLQNSAHNELIMNVSAYFDAIDLSNLSQAEEVYLLNNKPKKYVLELVKNGKPFAQIDLSKAVTFGYTTASFCWKKEQGVISLANLVNNGESCAKDTYKKVARLDKKVNYFKM